MVTCEKNILKQCDRLEEQIRRICHLLSLKIPETSTLCSTDPGNNNKNNNAYYKTLDVNQIYHLIELSSYGGRKDVLCKIAQDSFLKLKNARSFVNSSQVESSLKELCNGFLMIGLAYSKLYSPDSSKTTIEAAAKSNEKSKKNKADLIDVAVAILEGWDDFSEKITTKMVVEKVCKIIIERSECIEMLDRTWPTIGISKSASNLKKIEGPLVTRLTSYFNKEERIKLLMQKIREKSRPQKR